MFVIHLSKLEVQLHTNLTLAAVSRKVPLQQMGEREDTKVVRYHGAEEKPVKTIEEFEVWIPILNKSSVGIDNKYTSINISAAELRKYIYSYKYDTS